MIIYAVQLSLACSTHVMITGRAKTPIFGEGASAFFLGKMCVILAYFGKRGLKFTQTINKFFKIEKQKALGNTNKALILF
jgi:hypothetical protein